MRGALLVAALLVSPAVAQERLQDDEAPEIVVVGQRDREQQIRDFVDALSSGSPADPIARFDGSSVCPAAVGLSEPQNAAVAARMRRVAEGAGLRLAGANCEPNVLVIVAPDKKKVVDWLQKKRPGYFRDAADRYVEVRDQPGPVTAWHLEGLVDRSGLLVPVDRSDDVSVVNATGTSLRLTAAARPIFLASILVIEAEALIGLTTTQIADYSAMRAFAPADPARVARSAPTILNILDAPKDTPQPVTLTRWDFEYLKALYASPKYRLSPEQRAGIRRRMRGDGGRDRPE
jgi:hypothetical protein